MRAGGNACARSIVRNHRISKIPIYGITYILMARRILPDLGHLLLAFIGPSLIRTEFILLACAIFLINSKNQLTWHDLLTYDIVHVIMHTSIMIAIIHVVGGFYTACLAPVYYIVLKRPTKTYTMHAVYDPYAMYSVRDARRALYVRERVPYPRARRADALNEPPTT